MAMQYRKILARGLPLALLAFSTSSFAADDPWVEAFPEACAEASACTAIHGGLGVVETAGGAKLLLSEGAKPRGPLAANPTELLDRSARSAAMDEIIKNDPRAAALLAERRELEIIKVRLLAANGDAAALEALLVSPGMKDFEGRLAAFEGRRSELKQLEKRIGARTAELTAAVKKGQAIPHAMSSAAEYYRNFKPVAGLQIAIGAALIADGGARLLGVLQQRNPGYLPAVSVGTTTVKHLRNAPAAPEGGGTSMDVK